MKPNDQEFKHTPCPLLGKPQKTEPAFTVEKPGYGYTPEIFKHGCVKGQPDGCFGFLVASGPCGLQPSFMAAAHAPPCGSCELSRVPQKASS